MLKSLCLYLHEDIYMILNNMHRLSLWEYHFMKSVYTDKNILYRWKNNLDTSIWLSHKQRYIFNQIIKKLYILTKQEGPTINETKI